MREGGSLRTDKYPLIPIRDAPQVCPAIGNEPRNATLRKDVVVMHELECRVENRHLFFIVDGDRWLVDTGSPISIGNTGSIVIAGERLALTSEAFSMNTEDLSRNVGVDIAGLLGMDFLGRLYFRIDPAHGTVGISADGSEWNRSLAHGAFHWATGGKEIEGNTSRWSAHSVDVDLTIGIPTFSATVGRETTVLIFDTGAPLSYWQSPRRVLFPEEPDYDDFHPTLGRFTTTVHRVPVQIGQWEKDIELGRLPEPLGSRIEWSGASGILGLDTLGDQPLGLFFPDNQLLIPES